MSERLTKLADEIAGIRTPGAPDTGSGNAAFFRSMMGIAEVVLIKGIAEKLVHIPTTEGEIDTKRQLLAAEKPRIDMLVGKRGARDRYVKVLVAMHGLVLAQIEGRTEPTDEELGLVRRCFIATACYGSPDCPEVIELRAFRDESLLPSGLGRLLVGVYCWIAPPLARWIAERPARRRCAREFVVNPIARMIHTVYARVRHEKGEAR